MGVTIHHSQWEPEDDSLPPRVLFQQAPGFLEQEDSDGGDNVVLVRLFDDHRLVAVVKNACLVKPFIEEKYSLSRKCNRGIVVTHLTGDAVHCCLKTLLPPGTLLVAIPKETGRPRPSWGGMTTLSIAKAIAKYCECNTALARTTSGSRPTRVKVDKYMNYDSRLMSSIE